MQAPLWALEESVEDALVAYLKASGPAELRYSPAYTADTYQCPCVVVACESSENPVDLAQYSGHRQLTVEVVIGVEAVPEVQDGAEVRSPRERARALRGAVIDLLARDDLPAELNAVQSPGVRFSMAQLEQAARSVQEGVFQTNLTLTVIAHPQEVTSG